MNASLQCMANAPYMREFFTKQKRPQTQTMIAMIEETKTVED